MNEQPLISIIVPVYNVEAYLPQCLDSILNQTYPNIEVICIDDGSTDSSCNILRQYAETDSRLQILSQKNKGVSQARNAALKLIQGEYVAFVDADDWIDPETLESAWDAIVHNCADVVMWSYVSEYGSSCSPKALFPHDCVFEHDEVLSKLHRRFVGIAGEELKRPELADSLCPVWGKLYRRSVIEDSKAHFIDLSEIGTYEDGFFNLEVFYHVNRAVYLNQCFYHYRRSNASSVTSSYRADLFELWQNLYRKMERYIQEKDLPPDYNKALQNRIALGVLGLTLNISSAQKSFLEKRKELRTILKSEKYHTALAALNISEMPKKWKLFYGCAQYGNASALLFAGGGYKILAIRR